MLLNSQKQQWHSTTTCERKSLPCIAHLDMLMKKMVVGILYLVHGGVKVVDPTQDYLQLVVVLLGTGMSWFVNINVQ